MLRKENKMAKSVSEKVTELILRPNGNDSSEESSEEDPRVVEFDEEYEAPDALITEIRKRNVKLLSQQSPRYKGKISSRKELEQDDSESELEGDNEGLDAFNEQVENLSYASSENQDSGDSETEDSNDDEESENEEMSNVITDTNRQSELQKGMSVRSQLLIWEKLLELRIHSQKIINKSNQLPGSVNLGQCQNQELQQIRLNTAEKTGVLLNSFLELQNTLYDQFSELKTAVKPNLKRAPPASDDASDSPQMKRIGQNLDNNFTEFRKYRNAVLLKWDDRTKLLTPGAGSKRKALIEEFDIIRKIENTLINSNALIQKSRIPKTTATADDDSELNVESSTAAPNPNIYDDSEFYHQQLREFIEYKTNTSAHIGEVTKQYIELQKLRQKMKKKVDTRASKGRKIRYVVHNKLINFMAPDDTLLWTEESKNELCKSLFAP